MATTDLPPDLFDRTTLVSLAATILIVLAAYTASLILLRRAVGPALRFLFVWHMADALCHFMLEGSFLYHCFFSYVPVSEVVGKGGVRALGEWFPTPFNWLGTEGRLYGPQAGGDDFFAQLWMVYARADKRWAGVDLGVVSLELLTVFFDGSLALYICYCIRNKDPKASIWMIVLATCEIYGGFMTFCPEWLVGNINLDGSNFMYLWVYLFFFNMLWVFIPLYAIWYSVRDISSALSLRDKQAANKKSKYERDEDEGVTVRRMLSERRVSRALSEIRF
ncbi:hypothetical protein NLU13_1891 [Sarocladium strictum]|uniref:EXPERA domain-containing protein n=1 Tax=Sarocladium strictum TaxID=5046 RepID=A0AA39GSM7_SARSR|nr:hypothetical protein NLU13_1891 [Sarocladium strictum]